MLIPNSPRRGGGCASGVCDMPAFQCGELCRQPVSGLVAKSLGRRTTPSLVWSTVDSAVGGCFCWVFLAAEGAGGDVTLRQLGGRGRDATGETYAEYEVWGWLLGVRGNCWMAISEPGVKVLSMASWEHMKSPTVGISSGLQAGHLDIGGQEPKSKLVGCNRLRAEQVALSSVDGLVGRG
jgi:hypothetical protein